MRAPTPLLLASSLVLLAQPARAAQLELGWDTRVNWDSNVLSSPEDEESDFALYGGPDLGIHDERSEFEYRVDYRLRYEQYVDLSSANGFEHFAAGFVRWQPSPRSELILRQDASRTRGLSVDFLQPVPGIDPVDALAELQLRRTPIVRSTTSLSHSYQLTKLWSLQSNLVAELRDYEDDIRSSILSLRGSTQLVRPLSERLLAGFGAALTRHDFDESERTLDSGTTIYEGFGVLRYQISPTTALSLSGGPAWSQPDDNTDNAKTRTVGIGSDEGVTRLIDPTRCPQNTGPNGTISRSVCLAFAMPTIPGIAVDASNLEFQEVDVLGPTEDLPGSITFFGRAALTRVWRTVEAELLYERRASASAGLGSTDLDLALARISWLPDRRRWRFDLRGTWTLQQSATEAPSTDDLLSPIPVTVYVDDRGRVFDSPRPGTTAVPNAARVVAVRQLGNIDDAIELESYRIDLRAGRRIGQNLVANAGVGWIHQTSSGRFQEERTVDNLRFHVGLTWSLDPIDL